MPETSGLTLAGVWVAALGILGLLIRQVGPWRKQLTDLEDRLRKDLMDQLEKERTAHTAEIRAHAIERDEMGDRIAKLEKTIERQQAVHRAERALDRHRLNNLQACFDSMVMMLKASPEKAAEIIQHIEALRAEQMKAEALEKAAIHAANIQSAEA
jgi:sensor domain CHASE-containing protein